MDFITIPSKYRPVPFWSWNEKLDPEETRRQMRLMHDAGIGGVFMHARGGLQTEYMGEEWFENVSACIDEAKKLDMHAWAYDENGWPSGFGGGRVNGKGEAYCQKYLRRAEGLRETEHPIAQVDGQTFFYEVNPFYVDVLDEKVIRCFLDEIYEPYYQRFGNTFEGFFSDEPQISRNGIPWSSVLPERYARAYQDELIPRLPELFLETGDYRRTRTRFWKLITDLFSESYMKQIYDWCVSHGLRFTGHMVMEETFLSQITTNGAVMPHYEYFSIPGMDCLCRNVIEDLTPWQLGSAAQQLGKKQVLSETFALCGHNVSFSELRMIYGHQMLHGVNLLCQHLEGYSLRGIRKRDYPPAMYVQQPWWAEYERFCTEMARVGMVLSEGTCECDTLLLHPQTSAWIMYNDRDTEAVDVFYQKFRELVLSCDRMHLSFHLGDETLMERHGRVEGNALIIGEMRYTTVIVPEHLAFLPNTERLLEEYRKNGGVILDPDQIRPREDLVTDPRILYTVRKLDRGRAYFLMNYSPETVNARIKKGSAILNQYTGKRMPFQGEYTFAPYETLLLLDDGQTVTGGKRDLAILPTDGPWKLEEMTDNLLTLDRCDYYFDGLLQEKNGYVLNILNRAMKLGRPVRIRQVYHFTLDSIPGDPALLCETPDIYSIILNGEPVSSTDAGWYLDKAFRKIPLEDGLRVGENELVLECGFSQREEVYENLRRSFAFESEKNKLCYDMEIEPCYLIGRFGVWAESPAEELNRNAFRVKQGFRVGKMSETLTLINMESQGLLFFAGILTVSKEFELDSADYAVSGIWRGVNAVRVTVNGHDAGCALYDSDRIDCSEWLHPGRNTVTLKLYGNLRNMMGPHHLREGESYRVGPGSFFRENCVFSPDAEKYWNDDYCFVHTGLLRTGG